MLGTDRCFFSSRFLFAAGCLLFPPLTQQLFAQGYPPSEAVSHMKVADGFEVNLVASEPLVRQPVCIEFDDRGRLWVIQYLQYPNPEGLKRVQVDRYSRTKYDKVPEPPPHGVQGADRITILEDTDGDGIMDAGHDFVDGLNLASGMAHGHGGLFVLNVPYLLFYPDQNRDDIPDADPEVLLTGFGMEDAHSVANSLTWGPDGWLYGCQGSTVTANIRGIEFQQGVWRYHPVTHKFELFCEGGGNAWGLDFDRAGNLHYSTNYGGFILVNGVQGGYYVKSFAKHGELHNPYSYGFFPHAPHTNFQGGHVTVGGLVYQGDSFPDSFQGKYIAADLLGHGVYWHDISKRGSTVETAFAGKLLEANDTWFAPTDVTMGPDGSIYVTDWHDARTAHPDPDADWDRSNGRIYRIAAKGTPAAKPTDFSQLSIDELLEFHNHKSQWDVRHARQELARRQDQRSLSTLKETLLAANEQQPAIESLWTLLTLRAVDESLAMKLLDSPHSAVRYWTLRFLGDQGDVSEAMAHRLDEFAEQEPDVWVRQQLASTAARLPAKWAVPMINANINRDIDNDDPYLPLLWWWAVERHSIEGRDEVMRRFVRTSAWKSKLGREFLLPRLVRRYAAEGTNADLDSVVTLLKAVPEPVRDQLWEPVLQGRLESPQDAKLKQAQLDHPLSELVQKRWKEVPENLTLLKLALLFGQRDAEQYALTKSSDSKISTAVRTQYLDALGLVAKREFAEGFLSLIRSEHNIAVRLAALGALARINDPQFATHLIDIHQETDSESVQTQIRSVVLGRKASAQVWLQEVERGNIKPDVTPIEQIRQVALLDDPQLDKLVLKHWGKLEGASREEKLAEVRRLNNDLNAGPGELAKGRELFIKKCGICHQLFGEGKKIGPDLTTANRADRRALLINLVDPSSVIRKEYVSLVVATKDGRVLTGFPIRKENGGVTLVNNQGKETTVAGNDIEAVNESTVSLMPDDLYRTFTPQELRDLFAWLQSKGPEKEKTSEPTQ